MVVCIKHFGIGVTFLHQRYALEENTVVPVLKDHSNEKPVLKDHSNMRNHVFHDTYSVLFMLFVPAMKDHLFLETTIWSSLGWSLKTGFTVHVYMYM